MRISPFEIERYFARYEFSAPYLLSCSDCEPLMLRELLALSDEECRVSWTELWLGYTESQGHPLLRNEIAKLYNSIKPEEVLVIAPIEGIFVAMNVLLQKGDHLIVTFPGYQSLYQVAESIGCEVSRWEAEETKEWHFDVERLQALIKKNTKALVINFPHNPTGSTITRAELDQIIELARKHNLYIFSDEMYRFLELNPAERLPSVSDLYENSISLFGMSKTFGLPGLRIGWLTTKNKEIYNQLVTFKDYTSICSSGPSEILALMGLRAKEQLIQRNLGIIQDNIAICDAFFKKHSDLFSWNKPKAGSIAFARYLPSQGITALTKKLIEKKGLMVLPSTVFDYGDHHFRIGLGRKNIPLIVNQLEDFLISYKS